MSQQLERIFRQALELSPQEQLELIERLNSQAFVQSEARVKSKRNVMDFYAVAPNLLSGMDAQVWVSQLRDEWNEREANFNPYL
ncbi:hypothetical protein [Calothrix sp. NIES-3974]|uniref:hypothetical protein n=1 Tax=Calothrix sp. NIES-3974 TaxID=2005462 RepID=UPI000B5E437B|nr:hypothetical protein [Calothrix sp. NIES-3974]BAZ05129.1 hypothetical protein NIES3974_17750 [Calothrix sp. NIES-3974]